MLGHILIGIVIGVVSFLGGYVGFTALDAAVVLFVCLGAVVGLCIYTDEGDDDE